MALTKDDLKQIKTVMREEVSDVVETEVGNLAAMTKKEFDVVGERFNEMDLHFDRLEKGQKQIRTDISHLEFMATEMVRQD